MRRIAPRVAEWVERMIDPEPCAGTFLADDAVPETVLPVLRRMADEQLPVIVDTVRRLERWLDEHPNERIPRAIGWHAFTIARGTDAEVTAERAVSPFDQWMFQRPWDYYHSLAGESRAAADALLREVGAYEAMQTPIRRRVARERFVLVRGNSGSE